MLLFSSICEERGRKEGDIGDEAVPRKMPSWTPLGVYRCAKH